MTINNSSLCYKNIWETSAIFLAQYLNSRIRLWDILFHTYCRGGEWRQVVMHEWRCWELDERDFSHLLIKVKSDSSEIEEITVANNLSTALLMFDVGYSYEKHDPRKSVWSTRKPETWWLHLRAIFRPKFWNRSLSALFFLKSTVP